MLEPYTCSTTVVSKLGQKINFSKDRIQIKTVPCELSAADQSKKKHTYYPLVSPEEAGLTWNPCKVHG